MKQFVCGPISSICLLLAWLLVYQTDAHASEEEELAKKLSNPIANLISLPIQGNYDTGYGPDKGKRLTFNVQPVIPISISEDWNVISRTILPVTGRKTSH